MAGSERSRGKKYDEAVTWLLPEAIPDEISEMTIQALKPDLPAKLVFSALPTMAALELEPIFAAEGYVVCSNAAAFRQAKDVPLLIPEINPNHLALIENQQKQRSWQGFIVTSPNCSTTGIALPLKPIEQIFGIESVFATTLQAISGAGYPGISAIDVSNNVIPYIKGEEEKIEKETKILLGQTNQAGKSPHPVVVSAQCNRVNVLDGHTANISTKFGKKPKLKEIYQTFDEFNSIAENNRLPSSPEQILIVDQQEGRPQPRRDLNRGNGMSVSVGQIRPCPIFDFKFTSLVHNTIRGAAGGAILNAELLVDQGFVS